jgi:hypothetical protein
MMMKDSKTPFCCSKFSWHAKEFFRKFSKIWARTLKKGSPALVSTVCLCSNIREFCALLLSS